MTRIFSRIHAKIVPPIDLEGTDEVEPLGELESIGVCIRIARGVFRGLLLRLRVRHAKGHIYVGRCVQVLNAGRLTLGRNVKIEDYAEIQCRSQRGVVLGDGVTIGRNVSIRPSSYYGHTAGEGLIVGAGSAIGALSWIGASGHVTIGCDVLVGPRVTIVPENHRFDRISLSIKGQGVKRSRVFIEDDCWIGTGATILAGVRIGRGSIVAAGAVVARSFPPYSVIGGVPARLIRQRETTAPRRDLRAA